jgi:hypothetical protein
MVLTGRAESGSCRSRSRWGRAARPSQPRRSPWPAAIQLACAGTGSRSARRGGMPAETVPAQYPPTAPTAGTPPRSADSPSAGSPGPAHHQLNDLLVQPLVTAVTLNNPHPASGYETIRIPPRPGPDNPPMRARPTQALRQIPIRKGPADDPSLTILSIMVLVCSCTGSRETPRNSATSSSPCRKIRFRLGLRRERPLDANPGTPLVARARTPTRMDNHEVPPVERLQLRRGTGSRDRARGLPRLPRR